MTYEINVRRAGRTAAAMSALVLLAVITVSSFSVSAFASEPAEIVQGNLVFNVTKEWTQSNPGEVTLVRVEESPISLTIPAAIVYSAKQYMVKSISPDAFSGNIDLVTLILPDGLESIGHGALNNCVSLGKIKIPSSVLEIGIDAFVGCTGTQFYIEVDDGNTKYSSVDGMLTDKAKTRLIQGRNIQALAVPAGIKYIEDFSFAACENIKTVVLPQSLETIGTGSFFSCTKLKFVDFSGATSLRNIGMNAFSGCTSLESADLSKCVKLRFIGQNAFDSCSSLMGVKIPASVENIGYRAFIGCRSDSFFVEVSPESTHYASVNGSLYNFNKTILLKARNTAVVNIPMTVVSITDEAFHGCDLLESVSISDKITVIGDSAFNGCSNRAFHFIVEDANPNYASIDGILYSKNGKILIQGRNVDSYKAPANLTGISQGAFLRCKDLTMVDLSYATGLQEIGSAAFQRCVKLESVAMSPGIKTIKNNAFAGCILLSTVDLQTAVMLDTIEFNAFDGCRSLENIYISSAVSKIGDNAFSGCIGKKFRFDVDILSNYYASVDGMLLDKDRKILIKACNLEEVSVPSTVVKISDDAFGGFNYLKKVTIPASVEEVAPYAFFGCWTMEELIFTGISLPETIGADSFSFGLGGEHADVVVYSSFDATMLSSKFISNGYTTLTYKDFSGLHKVTIEVGRWGYSTPDGIQYLKDGGEMKLRFFVEPGHKISNVYIDGVSIGPVVSYNMSNIRSDVKVIVEIDQPLDGERNVIVTWLAIALIAVAFLVFLWYFRRIPST